MQYPFKAPTLAVSARLDDLLARLTLEEKIGQLMMDTPGIPRLGISAYQWWNEALHGVARNGIATVFPQAIGLAATWNTALHSRIAEVISTEARAKYHDTLRRSGGATLIYEGLTIWSPNINIFRDPRWGRGQETYGECPYLTGRLAVVFCRGLQGDHPHYLKTVATVKHYAVHSGPEALRHTFDARPTVRDLWETYLPAFEAGIVEGGALSLMSVYNAIDGVPGPVNALLLDEVLRQRWNFAGAVVGDVDCVYDVHAHHKYTKDAAESSALALRAGNDLCSGSTFAALPEALQRGLVTEADLDRSLRRLLALRMRLGQFEPQSSVPYARIPLSANDTAEHSELAREAARQSLVLLKNDGVLPLQPKQLRKVAVIGPVGDDKSALLGNYAGTPSRLVTLLEGIRTKFEAQGVEVVYEPGCSLARGFPENQFSFAGGCLYTEASCSVPGVKAEIYFNRELAGEPGHVRVDAQLDLDWDYYHPQPFIPVRDTSARWTAVLVPPVSGEYKFDVTLVGGARLWMGGELLLDDWEGGTYRICTLSRYLRAGELTPVRLELTQNQFTAKARLGWRVPDARSDRERALAVAQSADHVILTLGLTPDLEGEENPFSCEGFASGDKTSLALPATQQELLAAVAALGRPITLVLTTGSAVSFDPQLANAVLLAWYYGQRGGEAVAEVLLGEYNPAGRLPITFYKSEEDLPAFTDYTMDGRTYRYFKGEPLYAFGHGLSYTTFVYQHLTLAKATVAPGENLTATLVLTNSGTRAGDEVVQVYVVDARPGRPVRQLAGFQRVSLQAGETCTVELVAEARAWRRWDEARQDYVIDPVLYKIEVGGASDRVALAANFTVAG